MNDSTIQMIAQAIIANTKVIQSLIDALPHDTKQAVAEVVAPAPAPVIAPVAVPLVVPTPVAPVAAPVVVVAPVPVMVSPSSMPAPPTFAPVAPVAAPSAAAPFTDAKGLIDFVMAAYRTMGPQKGAQIQTVLTGLGYANINDIKQSDYAALFAGIEALKAS
jgi:hypothetical protein